ncbi:MAG TPA: hypothetical protein VGH38_10320, partial [Bryobacteraceae bacterium]
MIEIKKHVWPVMVFIGFVLAGGSAQAANCQFNLNKTNASYGVNGGSDAINVLMTAGCGWTAFTNVAYVHISNGTNRVGNDFFFYTVDAYQGPNNTISRTAKITVVGPNNTIFFTITQGGTTCVTSILHASEGFTPTGGQGTVTVAATPGCSWNVDNSGAPFVSFPQGSAGSGDGILNYSVAANPGPGSRTGTLKINGRTFTVVQQAPGNNANCVASVFIVPQVALEGRTDVMGDVNVTCHALNSATTATVELTLSTQVTNTLTGIEGPDAIDALLIQPNKGIHGHLAGYNVIRWTGITIAAETQSILQLVKADGSFLAGGGNTLPVAITGEVRVTTPSGPLPLTYAVQNAVGGCAPPAHFEMLACSTPALVFQKTADGFGGFTATFQESAPGMFSGGNTRLRATLSNVPNGAAVWAPLTAGQSSGVVGVGIVGTQSNTAQVSNGATAQFFSTDASGNGGGPVTSPDPGAPCFCAKANVVGGTVAATWVVSNESTAPYVFPLLVTGVNGASLSGIQFTGGTLGPVSSVGVATNNQGAPATRFQDFSTQEVRLGMRANVGLALKAAASSARISAQAGTSSIDETVNVFNDNPDTPVPVAGVTGYVDSPTGPQPCTFPAGGAISLPPGGSTSVTGDCGPSFDGPIVGHAFTSSNQPNTDPREVTVSDSLGAAVNPLPTISSLSPTNAMAGTGTFTLTVNGTGFVSSSVVNWNGASRTTTFISASQLQATINPADIALVGTGTVTVTSPPPGGGTSGGLPFAIGVGAPSPISVTPASGGNSNQNFTFVFNDSSGAQNLVVVNALINNSLDARHACYIAYVVSTHSLLLVDDAGDAGGPYVASNSQCSVSLVSANTAGNSLTLVVGINFQAAFGGNKIVYMAAGNAGSNSGWKTMGVWKVPSP